MAFKNVLFVGLLIVSVVVCKPRDSTAVHADNVIVPKPDSQISDKDGISRQTENEVPAVQVPGRVSCEADEPTEDIRCQEHCLPKGYSYGLCISNMCSCI